MTADGYSNTPLSGMALSYNEGSIIGCGGVPVYAKITETIFGKSWFSDVVAIAADWGDFELEVGKTSTLVIRAVSGNKAFIAPVKDLVFTSDSVHATVSPLGVVTGTSVGESLIHIKIKDKPDIETSVTVTVI